MRTFSRTMAALTAAATAVSIVAFPSAATAAAAAGPARADRAPNHKISKSTSSNWSGYAVTGGTYKTVTASWVEPAVTCSGATAYSSFWIGIDGDTSDTVEQTGTSADCIGTTPVYYAWYEMYPKYPTNYRDEVAPGDHFTSTVATDGAGTFTLTLANTTRGWTESVTKKLKRAQLASAEVIAEAPSSSSGVLPLADFGTVSFSGAQVNGVTLTSHTVGIDPITMQTGNTVKAKPSKISSGAFSVVWKHS